MKNLCGLKFILLWAIVIPVVLSGCNSHDANLDSSRFDEIARILKSISVHPSKIEIETNNDSDGSNASITRKYKSDVPFDEVRKFYLNQLINQGWQLIEERELRDRARFRDERVLHFTRGEFLSVQYAGKRKEDLGWDYAIRIAHPSDWKEKI